MSRTSFIEAIPYRIINGQTLFLDIVRPEPLPATPLPVVIYLFGSGWAYNLRQEQDQNPARFLASHTNVCVASIDYRVSSQAIFPAQIADARAAVRWLRANAASYALDATRIGAWGYSSGGHLASLLGTAADDASLDDSADLKDISCRVQAVFSVSGPVDFLQMGGQHNEPDSSEALLIGGPVQENSEKVRRANPLTYISRAQYLPPFCLMHGEQDESVNVDQSRIFYQALVNAGADATLLLLPEAGHDIRQPTPYWDPICQAGLKFLQKYLGVL